ncbi:MULTISPECIES: MFS transporter [Haloarcula]|uniref:MFS transporter n=1 Tax=Haloarcula TaxID=2237 RepID=UPI0023EBDADA|nr:MFS transporter [Halomicroarcula sp. XH51]
MSWSLPRRLSAETPNALIGTVSFGHFLSHAYFLTFPPLFPLLFAQFDVTYAELGLLVSSLFAMMFVFQIPFGWVVDKGYAKPVLVAGLLLTAGGLLGASTATSYPALLAFALVSGVGQATYHPANYTLIDVVSTDERAGRNFSLHTFAGYAGSGFAPVVIGGLGLRYGWRVALVLAGIVGIVYAILVQLGVDTVYANELETRTEPTDDDEHDDDESVVRELLRPFFRLTILAMFLFFVVIVVAEAGIQSFTIVFLVESLGLTESTGNTALTTFFVLASFGVLIGGYLADRFPPANVIFGCIGGAAAVTFLLTLEILPATVLASLALFGAIGLGYGLAMPARDRLVAEYSPAESVGKSFGLVFTGAAVGGTVGPVMIGAAIDVTRVGVSMFLVATFFLAGAGIIGLLKLGTTSGQRVPLSLRRLFN